jgi:hypothetical protein
MISLTNNFILNTFIASIGVMMIFFPPLMTGSCGGNDMCGKKWCFVGIIDKYYTIIFIIGVILILYGIINIAIGVL